MKSVMNHQFSRIPSTSIQRSVFDRSHGHKTTFDSGYLVPIFCDEVLPGDTYHLKGNLFGRMATPIFPIMDNMFLETFFFFIPNRLLWDNWQKFNGEQINPGDTTDYLVPSITAPSGGYQIGSLEDHLGLPTLIPGIEHIALFHRAYNLVYNEWFRDQNLQDSVPVPKGDGPDDPSSYTLLRRGKRHDYFTSCLPWPQKGPGVELPIGGTAPVMGTGQALVLTDGRGDTGPLGQSNFSPDSYQVAYTSNGVVGGMLPQTAGAGSPILNGSQVGVTTDPNTSGLVADLSSATAATINSLRQAFQLQRLLERDARGGTRYTELLRAHFGVISPDARLQRPEYLGGSHTRIIVNPVQQTSASDSTSPQGNLAAYGVIGDSFHGFSQSFVEHGVIIGLVNVRADLTYQQGLARKWSRQTRYDFYWPALAHLGEQAVLNKEIFAQGPSVLDASNEVIDDQVFGYQERWAEYRYFPSQITGLFRSTGPTPLDSWHLSQKFDSLPKLNAEFIVDNPPIDRVIAVPSEPQFILDSYWQLKCARPMPVYSVPGLIDHF